jgi:hypothetical protein
MHEEVRLATLSTLDVLVQLKDFRGIEKDYALERYLKKEAAGSVIGKFDLKCGRHLLFSKRRKQ